MKKTSILSLFCVLLALASAGCKANETADDSMETTEAASQEETIVRTLGYITGHGETDTAELTKMFAQLETDGYTWETLTLTEIPAALGGLILSDPKEDLTREELSALDEYMDAGGQVLLLMPASDADTRFKYLEQFLEEYCIALDYQIVSETSSVNMVNDDPYFLTGSLVSYPSGMTLYSDNVTTFSPFMRNARCFHIVYGESYNASLIDCMVQTGDTAVGTPWGGVEDDPLTYEGEALDLMVYSQNKDRSYSAVVAVGSNDFLLDEHYDEETSKCMTDFIYSTLDWFMRY